MLALSCVAVGLTAIGSAAGLFSLPPPLALLNERLHTVFPLHMVTGGLGLVLLPLVLLLRRRAAWHRPLGRIAAALLLAAAVTGLPSGLLSEATGAARAGFAMQALLCGAFVALGWRAIRARDAACHARWMLRAAAVVSGVLWLRLAMPAAVGLWPWLSFDDAYAGIAWGSWSLPLAVVLLVQWRHRPGPGAGLRRPMDQLAVIRTSGFGTVQQAPSASMKTTQSR